MKIPEVCTRVIRFSFSFLFLFTPLVMTPFNYELFEFNKMLLVYFLTTIIVASWLIKMVLAKKFLFRHTFMDIPLLVFLISQLISFYLSIDHHTSWWGYYSRFNGGLLSLIAYLSAFWAYASNMEKNDTKRMIRYLLAGATATALYGVAEHFGVDAKYWVQDVKNRVFSTLGQPNWLAAYLAALAPLTWGLALNSKLKTQNSKRQNKIQKPLKFNGYFLFLIFYICILFTRSRSGLLGFGAGFFVFWGIIFLINRCHLKTVIKPFLIFTFSVFAFSLLIGTPWTKNNFQFSIFNFQKKIQPTPRPSTEPSPILISKSTDIRKVVWQGAIKIWRHYPIFGTGPETFAYSYYWFRPRKHNDLSEWDFLYNKAHNEYLNYAANTGTVGLLAYLGVIGAFVFWNLKKIFKEYKNSKNLKIKKINHLLEIRLIRISLLAGFIGILVTNFFGFSVVPVNLLFFLFPALSISLGSQSSKTIHDDNTYHRSESGENNGDDGGRKNIIERREKGCKKWKQF